MKSKPFSSFFLWIAGILICIHPAVTEGAPGSLENQIKKIVMMMNIVAKEYQLGISDGEIMNADEYEESQVFLKQAFNRFKKLPARPEQVDSVRTLQGQFLRLTEMIQSRRPPADVRAAVAEINSGLLENYGIKLSVSPSTPVSLENGERIYQSNCAVCHGKEGAGKGPLASQLDPPPANLADPEVTGDPHTNPYDNFQVINVGIANTAMMGWSDILTEPELWDVTYYIRTFSNATVEVPLVATAGGSPALSSENGGKQSQAVIREIRTFLDQSLETYKKGDIDPAADLAFDAYLAYEKIESPLTNQRKALGLRLESSFSRYRAEIKRNADPSLVEKIYQDLHSDLDQAGEVLQTQVGFAGLFIQSFSIILREGFEAILIVAALITFLTKSRNRDKVKTIYWGVLAGVAGSFLTAYLFHEVLHVSVESQELLEGWIMLLAVVVLFWVSYWLVSKIEAEKWQQYITSKMKTAVTTGSSFALALVAFLSVYREGFETVLFYKALYLYAGEGTQGILPGFFAGCVVLALVFFLLNRLGVRIPIRWFFAFTSVFLYFMAFIFMGKGLHELQMGKVLPMTHAEFAPHISWLGMYPTWETLIGQSVLVGAYLFALVYTFGIKPEVATQTLKTETSNIQNDIHFVHNLVEHISHHARRCEIFLKDTGDQDLRELSQHLKEIDQKVHELSDHVTFMENQLLDEYERLGQRAFAQEKKKELH